MQWAVIVTDRVNGKQYVSDWHTGKQLLGYVTRGLMDQCVSFFHIAIICNHIRSSMDNATREPVEEMDVFGWYIEVHEKEIVNANV